MNLSCPHSKSKGKWPLGGSHRCIQYNSLFLAKHQWDGCADMRRSGNMIRGRGRRSGGWTSNNGGGWNNSALNRGLRERTNRHLKRGMCGNLPTLVLALHL